MSFTSNSGPSSLRSGPKQNRFEPKAATCPVKVLHIINDLAIGGAEMMLYRLLAQENDARLEHSVISLMDRGPLSERIRALNIPVCSPRMRPVIPSPQSVWRLLRIVNRLKPNLIHGWLYHGSLAAQVASIASKSQIPVIWGIHCSMYSLDFEKRSTAAVVKLCARLSRKAAAIVFVSHLSQSQHHGLGYSQDNNLVIPNGIDTDVFVPSSKSRLEVRSELDLADDALIIGNINRYHPMKDHANFLQAAAMISREQKDAHFLLAGRDVASSNTKLMNMIQDLGLQHQTHLLGERSDIPRLIAALDILSLSSLYGESFPVVVAEGMACAVPCVVTNLGDSAWLLGDTGRIVEPGNPAALARAWKELTGIGPEGRASLGNSARARVANNFSLATMVNHYEMLYEETLRKDPRHADAVRLVGSSAAVTSQTESGA